MKKYIIGGLIGLIIGATVTWLFQPNKMPEHVWGFYDYARPNDKLGVEKLSETAANGPTLPNDFPVITVDSQTPLISFTKGDIHKTCVHVPAEVNKHNTANVYVADFYLTPEARKRLANKLAAVDGQQVSVHLLSAEIHIFQANRPLAAKLMNTDTAEAETADFEATFTHSVSATALAYINQTGPIAPCNPSASLTDIPGYADFIKADADARKRFKETTEATNSRVE